MSLSCDVLMSWFNNVMQFDYVGNTYLHEHPGRMVGEDSFVMVIACRFVR